jgi:hypothetical protein
MRIVGVVGAVKQYSLDIEGRIDVYMPTLNAPWHVPRVTGARSNQRDDRSQNSRARLTRVMAALLFGVSTTDLIDVATVRSS